MAKILVKTIVDTNLSIPESFRRRIDRYENQVSLQYGSLNICGEEQILSSAWLYHLEQTRLKKFRQLT